MVPAEVAGLVREMQSFEEEETSVMRKGEQSDYGALHHLEEGSSGVTRRKTQEREPRIFRLTSLRGDNQNCMTRPHPEESSLLGKQKPMEAAAALDCLAALASVIEDNQQQEQQQPKESYRLLKKQDRSQSLPARIPSMNHHRLLPRKPCLKRTSSYCGKPRRSSSSSSTTRLKRRVNFSKLDIREYSISISDHPSCSRGPPIQLGWEYRDKEPVALDVYEKGREPRRRMHQMILSYRVRQYLLLKRAGYSKHQIRDAMQEVNRVKRQRMVTDLFLPVHRIDETVENLLHRTKALLRIGFGE